jgi:hypothetical protein
MNVIGTKCVFKNKQGEDGEVVRNKDRLVAQGFSQVEGLDFGKTFTHVSCFEAIRILLAFTTFKGFKLYHMLVKNVFLNDVIHKDIYVRQPSSLHISDLDFTKTFREGSSLVILLVL